MTVNITLLRSLYDAWNDRDFDKQAEAMAPNGTIVVVGTGDAYEGPDGSRAYARTWADGFPDGRVTVDHVMADGDSAVVEFTGRGTHTGTLETSMGPIPPTGRSLTLKLCDVVRFENDKIILQHSYFDSASVMAQLGLLPEQSTIQQ